MIVKSISKKAELVKELKINDCELCPAITTEITARAFAGIGNPLNVLAWVVSTLKTASRKAPHTGISADMSKSNKVFTLSKSALIGAFKEREFLSR